MKTTLHFHVPFPLHGLPARRVEATVNTDWPRLEPDGSYSSARLPTKATFAIIEHEGSPWLRAAGWSTEKTGNATATYSGEAHGALSITRVTLEVPTLLPIGLSAPPDLFEKLAMLVNGFIDFHTAKTMTLWTPRATPRDIIDLRYAQEGVAGAREGQILSFANDQGLRVAMRRLTDGDSPLYAQLADNYSTLWAATVLDGLRELMALRTVRAASLAAIGFELYINQVLSLSSNAAAAERESLSTKVTKLLAPLIGGSLASPRFQDAATSADWELVLHGRNALLHKQVSTIAWTSNSGPQTAEVQSVDGSVNYIRAVLTLRRLIHSKLAPSSRAGG